MKKHKFWLVICLLIIMSLLVVACGADEEPTAVPEPEDVSQEEPAEEPEPVEEETSITILIPEDPAAFSSYVADTGYSQMLMELVMLSVTDIDAEGNIFPELAAELPTVENGGVNFDEENWTMDVTWKLRDDIFWADGEPVTADDVIFTWDAIADPEMGTWTDGLDYTDSIEKVSEPVLRKMQFLSEIGLANTEPLKVKGVKIAPVMF